MDGNDPARVGRPIVTYGTEDDPGFEFAVASVDCSLSELVPSEEERKADKRVWIASDFPQDELLSGLELAFASNLGRFEGLSGASAQVTTFSCGGFAVGIRITHCLSDAVCLVQFAKNWAQRTRNLFSEGNGQDDGLVSEIKPPEALFDPSLLDRHAGVIRKHPDPEKVKIARPLPMHRYDWWKTDAPGYPSWATASSEATKPTEEQLRNITLSPSTTPPWTTWDFSLPVDHVQIRFSGEEVQRMKYAAQAEIIGARGQQQNSTMSSPGMIISRLDALLAHVWLLINHARRPKGDKDDDDEPVYLDISLGLRTRVDPPLPETFVGSPILLTHISLSSNNTSSSSLGAVALSVRETMAQFTPEAVSAYMHDAAHEVSPQRLWQAFLGKRHTLVTSWTRTGCYEVDFVGNGNRARYVQGRMPRMDGVLQIVDVGEGGKDYDVSLCLEREAMRRFLGDERRLRAYEV